MASGMSEYRKFRFPSQDRDRLLFPLNGVASVGVISMST
jgi:hypothetical protein